MPVYTVHAPVADGERRAADQFVFVRDGFYVWAFLAGAIWLACHRLWLALVGYLVVTVGAALALAAFHVAPGPTFAALLLIAFLMGLEAASLWRWTLTRRGFRQVDIVVADDEEAAERRFFDRWISGQRAIADDRLATDRGAPPPTRDIPGQPFSRPPDTGIIGLFPHPGASR